MGKIGDLFVKLGLKNSEFKKGMAEASADVQGFGGKMKAIGTAAKAVWAAIGVAAVKAMHDLIASSNKFGDAWDRTMAKCKGAWNTFLTSLTSWNWDKFGDRMRDAMDAAGRLATTKDAEFEVMNSIRLRKAGMQEELELLRIQSTNQNATYKEREAAAKKYLSMIEGLYEDEARYRQKLLADTVADYYAGSGIDFNEGNADARTGQLRTFLERLEVDGDMMTALASAADGTKEGYDKYLDWVWGAVDEREREFRRVAKSLYDYYNTVAGRDTANGAVVDAFAKLDAVRSAKYSENRRIYSSLNTAAAGAVKDIDLGALAEQTTEQIDPMLEAIREEIDTLEALAAETEEVTDASDAMYERWRLMHGLPPIEEVIDPDIADIIQQADAKLQQFGRDIERTEKYAVDLKELLTMGVNSAVQGFSDALQEMFDQLFSIDEGDADAVFAALLKPLAETAKKMGEIMLAAGIGMSAFGEALKNPTNAPLLIAAGAALIAIGAAASAALSSLAGGGASGATATTSTGAGMTGATTSSAELTVYVKGTVKGSDIILSGEKTTHEWGK